MPSNNGNSRHNRRWCLRPWNYVPCFSLSEKIGEVASPGGDEEEENEEEEDEIVNKKLKALDISSIKVFKVRA